MMAARPTLIRSWLFCGSNALATDASTIGTGLSTVKDADWLLLDASGSGGVSASMVAVLLMTVPSTVAHGTAATTVNCAFSLLAIVGFVHVMAPEAPTAGVSQSHPAGDVNDTNVVPAGTASPSVTLPAHTGPLLTAVIV